MATVFLSLEKVSTTTLLGVGLGALVIVLGLAAGMNSEFDGAGNYGLIAENLVRKGLYSIDGDRLTAYRPPIYPLYLALHIAAFGESYKLAAIASQALFDIACGALVFLLAYRVFKNKRGAFLALLLYALHYKFHVESVDQRETVLFAFLLLLFFCLLTVRRSVLASIGLAGVAALAYLTRPTGLLLLPLALIAILAENRSPQRLAAPALTGSFSMLLIIAPWFGYVYINFHTASFMPSSTAGINLYHGNNPDFHKFFPYVDVDGMTEVIRDLKQQRNAVFADEVLTDRFLRREAWTFIAQNPLRFAQNGVLKLVSLYSPVPVPLGKGTLVGTTGNVRLEGYRFQVIGPSLITHTVVMSLILLGGILFVTRIRAYAPEQRRLAAFALGLMALATILHVITVGETRYRLPFDPLLMVFAGEALAGRVRTDVPAAV